MESVVEEILTEEKDEIKEADVYASIIDLRE